VCASRLRPRRSAPELGTGNEPRRDGSGYLGVAWVSPALAVGVTSVCRLLRYRSYLATVRDIVDRHGLPALPIIDSILGHSSADA
jgi:hypothetical protein